MFSFLLLIRYSTFNTSTKGIITTITLQGNYMNRNTN